MKKLPLLLMLVGLALPALAAKRVSVERLGEIVTQAHDAPDAKAAQQLSNLELTERLSTARLEQWKTQLPGVESQRALVELADASVFLKLPAADIEHAAPPAEDTQHQLMARALVSARIALARMPNFFATRESLLFENLPATQEAGHSVPGQPMHFVNRASATVLYRKGAEVLDTGSPDASKAGMQEGELFSSGQFGPVLAVVLADASQGKLTWSHWERMNGASLAVFRYSVPRKLSHFSIGFSHPRFPGDAVSDRPAYSGEIALDPNNSAVLRLTLRADLKPSSPMVKSNLMVEYGPVEIAGKTYICPLRSVAFVLAHQERSQSDGGPVFLHRAVISPASDEPPLRTLLNDVAFTEYHILRSDASMLKGFTAVPDANLP